MTRSIWTISAMFKCRIQTLRYGCSPVVQFFFRPCGPHFSLARAPSLDPPLCFLITVEALVSGHSRGAEKESATGAGRLRECKIQSLYGS